LGQRWYWPEVGRFVERDPLAIHRPFGLGEWAVGTPGSAEDLSLVPDDDWVAGYGGAVDIPDGYQRDGVYAYAANNPLSLTDATGENPVLRAILAALCKWGPRAARAVAAAGKAAWRGIKKAWDICKRIRCRIKTHGPHHYFGWPFNAKRRHIQVTCWIAGKKVPPFINMHIPY